MACFIVPAAEAIAVTAATKLLGHKKQKKQQRSDSFRNGKIGLAQQDALGRQRAPGL
ncbi:hypothetical protein M5E89_03190 [Acidaminococcus intestini]|nr:hypothetical protein M5E89_03190 [Acidaminococcus intestini]